MLLTLLDQSAPAVAPVAIPSSFVFRVLVKTLLVEPSAILSAFIAALLEISALTRVVAVALYVELISGISPAISLEKILARLIFLSSLNSNLS